MSIDTTIPGDPASIRAVATWIRDSYAGTVAATADSVRTTIVHTDSGWDGPASDKALERLGVTARVATTVSEGARSAAAAVDRFAEDLQSLHQRMDRIRLDALAAGLTVIDGVILDPSDPADPTDPTDPADPASVARRHALRALEHARDAVDAERRLAIRTLVEIWNGLVDNWAFHLADLVGGVLEELALRQASALGRAAQDLATRADELLEAARTAPAGTAEAYRTVDLGRTLTSSADEVATAAENLASRASRAASHLGAATAVLGIGLDIAHGKPAGQAVTSGLTGLGASIAAGAAIGSLVPVAGTALGALGGTIVGICASGGVDALFTEGPAGMLDGAGGALVDTGSAIADLAGGAWDAVF